MPEEIEVLWSENDYRVVPATDVRWAGSRKVRQLRLEQRHSSMDRWTLVAYVDYLRWPNFAWHSKSNAIAFLQGYAKHHSQTR